MACGSTAGCTHATAVGEVASARVPLATVFGAWQRAAQSCSTHELRSACNEGMRACLCAAQVTTERAMCLRALHTRPGELCAPNTRARSAVLHATTPEDMHNLARAVHALHDPCVSVCAGCRTVVCVHILATSCIHECATTKKQRQRTRTLRRHTLRGRATVTAHITPRPQHERLRTCRDTKPGRVKVQHTEHTNYT